MTKWHRELIRRLEDAGIRVTSVGHRPRSIALDCELNGGHVRYFTAISPSDQRAMNNAFHDIARALRPQEVR